MTQHLHIYLDPSRHRAITTLLVLISFALLMLGGTWYFFTTFYFFQTAQIETPPWVSYVWVQFNLAAENNLAAWFSSMLLLLIAVTSAFCFVLDRHCRPLAHHQRLHYGWLVYALVFALLSLDEMGAFHERIGMLAVSGSLDDHAAGWEVVLAPVIGLVAVFLVTFNLVYVRKVRVALLLSCLGTLLFLTIPIQEHVESTLRLSSETAAWQRPVLHILLEEGTELAGSFCFLSAAGLYAIQRITANAPIQNRLKIYVPVPQKSFLTGLAALLFLAGTGMILVQYSTRYLQEGEAGVAVNWFPSALAGLVALLYLLLWDTVSTASKGERLLYLAHAWLSLALSGYYGANLHQWRLDEQRHLVYLGFYILTLLMTILLIRQIQDRWSQMGLLIWILLLSMAWVLRAHAAPFVFGAFAVLMLTLPLRLRAEDLSPDGRESPRLRHRDGEWHLI